jgi:hypothetical protein
LTVNVWPPIVSVPDRGPPEFDATLYCTVPLPLPLPPDVTVIQDALLPAVHGQPPPAVTDTLPVPPPAGAFAFVGEIEIEQPLAWLTVNVWPAIVSVPDRSAPEFAATL